MNAKTVLEALSILTTPSSGKQSSDVVLNDTLNANLNTFNFRINNDNSFEKIKNLLESVCSSDEDVQWTVVKHCLLLLNMFKELVDQEMSSFKKTLQPECKTELCKSDLKVPQLSPDTLSFSQQKIVNTALQFITCFGVSRCLLPGVGIPIERRSEFGWIVKQSESFLSPFERKKRLVFCLEYLLALLKCSALQSFVLSKNLTDILAALIQLSYAPSRSKSQSISLAKKSIIDAKHDNPSKGCNVNSVSPCDNLVDENRCNVSVNDSTLVNTIQNSEITNEERRRYLTWLNELFDTTQPSLIVRELVFLQGYQGREGSALSRSPSWLRNVCGRLLSELLQTNGVLNVLNGIFAGDGGSPYDWRKCDAVAKIIANCPKRKPHKEYYKLIGPQILELVTLPDSTLSRQYLRVSSSVLAILLAQLPDVADEYILQPLLKPLSLCMDDRDISVTVESTTWVDEAKLTNAINSVHKVFVVGAGPSTDMISCLKPYIYIIMNMYNSTRKNVSHNRATCHDILLNFMKKVERNFAIEAIKSFVYDNHPDAMMSPKRMHPSLTFASGPGGGIQIVTKSTRTHEDSDYTLRVESCVDLLKDLQKDGLAGDFFISLLKKLTEILSSFSEDGFVMPSKCEEGKELLELEYRLHSRSTSVEERLIVVSLLGAMCENLSHTCLKHTKQVIQFVKVTLERGVYILRNTDDEMFGLFENETLSMAMGLLTATMGGAMEISRSDREMLKELLPLLQDIADNHHNSEIQEMANDIRISIATYGAVWSEIMQSASNEFSHFTRKKAHMNSENTVKTDEIFHHSSVKPKKTLIEELPDTSHTDIDSETEPLEKIDNYKDVSEDGIDHNILGDSELERAFKELCDPLIPVRGHGLIRLTRLVQSADPDTLKRRETVLRIFQENIDHADTYLYLQSIQGLALLAERYPDMVLPTLITQFSQTKDKNLRNRSVELRLKLGEVLVKTSRSLGDTIPKYGDSLINAFLVGAKDDESTVRASSLSNLGEICKILRFSLGKIIHEVLSCCSCLLKLDKTVEVRQAAALILTLLLQGVGKDALKILDSALRDLYHLLKLVSTTEREGCVLQHVHLALEELNNIMRDFLFPTQSLSHRIHVLDIPSK